MRFLLLLAGAIIYALAPSAHAYPLCVDLVDAYALALADTQGALDDKWKALLERGNCANIKGASYVLTIDSYIDLAGDRTRVVQYALMGKTLYGIAVGDPPAFEVTYKPTGNEDQATREWFRNARLTPAARRRLSWSGCCDNADRFVTTFENTTGTDEWFYYKDGHKVEIPWDTIHFEDDPTMPQQLKVEGVLFIVNGVVACFWPPQTGG